MKEPAQTVPPVTVVIPTVRRDELVERCVAALDRQSAPPAEVVVVDSSPRAEEAAFSAGVPVRTISVPAGTGFAAAANVGARSASGEFVAFVNDDVEVEPQWLEELLACAARRPNASAVTGKIFSATAAGILDGAGDAMTRALKAYRRGQGETDSGRYDVEEEVFAVSGTACLWRADAFEALGGFDEAFSSYYEDVDLGFRARLLGYEQWYAPTSRCTHVGGATTAVDSEWFESYAAVKNRWLMIIKDAPGWWLRRHCLLIATAEAASLVRSALRGSLLLHLRAYRAILRDGPATVSVRKTIVRRPEGEDAIRRLVVRRFPPLQSSFSRRRPRRGAGSVEWAGR